MTREYIRQIIAKADLDDNTRKSVTGLLKQRKPRPLPRLTTNIVNHWLSEIGWRYCSAGEHVQPMEEFLPCKLMCRSCNRERAFKYRHEHAESFLEHMRRYRVEHPEVNRRAQHKYCLTHAEEIKKRRSLYKNDPAKYDAKKSVLARVSAEEVCGKYPPGGHKQKRG